MGYLFIDIKIVLNSNNIEIALIKKERKKTLPSSFPSWIIISTDTPLYIMDTERRRTGKRKKKKEDKRKKKKERRR